MNIGAGFEISIKDLVSIIVDLMDFRGAVAWDRTKPTASPGGCSDTTKAGRNSTSGRQPLSKKGLKKTIDWLIRAVAPPRRAPFTTSSANDNDQEKDDHQGC